MVQKHPLSAKYPTLFNSANVNTPLRLSHFFGQIQHESGLKAIEENLRYSAQRLLEIFPKYFTRETAKHYAMNPIKIANRVYANRMGNGPEDSGDGFRFRGRGFLQVTGRNNYTALTNWARKKGYDVDYVENPELLLREADALIAALWYWEANGLNKYCDKDDVLSVSRIINIGNPLSKKIPHGMSDRKIQTNRYKSIFECK